MDDYKKSRIKQFEVLYTKDKVQKLKKWHDGILKYYHINKKIVLSDEQGFTLGEEFIKNESLLQEGNEIPMVHFLVEIGDKMEDTVRDASSVVVKRNHKVQKPIKARISKDMISTSPRQVPRPLNAVTPRAIRPAGLVVPKSSKKSPFVELSSENNKNSEDRPPALPDAYAAIKNSPSSSRLCSSRRKSLNVPLPSPSKTKRSSVRSKKNECDESSNGDDILSTRPMGIYGPRREIEIPKSFLSPDPHTPVKEEKLELPLPKVKSEPIDSPIKTPKVKSDPESLLVSLDSIPQHDNENRLKKDVTMHTEIKKETAEKNRVDVFASQDSQLSDFSSQELGSSNQVADSKNETGLNKIRLLAESMSRGTQTKTYSYSNSKDSKKFDFSISKMLLDGHT